MYRSPKSVVPLPGSSVTRSAHTTNEILVVSEPVPAIENLLRGWWGQPTHGFLCSRQSWVDVHLLTRLLQHAPEEGTQLDNVTRVVALRLVLKVRILLVHLDDALTNYLGGFNRSKPITAHGFNHSRNRQQPVKVWLIPIDR
ncbi:hypothetical protein D3C78_1366070 [compost metagenome]